MGLSSETSPKLHGLQLCLDLLAIEWKQNNLRPGAPVDVL